MVFYCPNCRQEYEAEASETIKTQAGRLAYKAACPKCGGDMAEFLENQGATQAAVATTAKATAPEAVVPKAEVEGDGVSPQDTIAAYIESNEPVASKPAVAGLGEQAVESTELAQNELNKASEAVAQPNAVQTEPEVNQMAEASQDVPTTG